MYWKIPEHAGSAPARPSAVQGEGTGRRVIRPGIGRGCRALSGSALTYTIILPVTQNNGISTDSAFGSFLRGSLKDPAAGSDLQHKFPDALQPEVPLAQHARCPC